MNYLQLKDNSTFAPEEAALVEMNDAFSIGMYEGMEKCYGDLLTTRWKELTFKGRSQNYEY